MTIVLRMNERVMQGRETQCNPARALGRSGARRLRWPALYAQACGVIRGNFADVAGTDAIASQRVCRHRAGSFRNRHPSNGLDMNNSCRSHARSGNTPGYQKRPCGGHDIGPMVAYAQAAQFSRETVAAVPNHFARTTNESVAEQICGCGPADTRYFDPTNEPKSSDAEFSLHSI
jgi:hypothetical protein